MLKAFNCSFYTGTQEQFWVEVAEHVKSRKGKNVEVYLYETKGTYYAFAFQKIGPQTMAGLGLSLITMRILGLKDPPTLRVVN